MLVITVELLLGTFRGDPSGLAATGQLDRAEWPPSPARLFAALVAADGTRDRMRVTTGVELDFLEGAPPPVVYASPAAEVHHQLLEGRYVVQHTGGPVKATHQEYLGRSGAKVNAGVRAAPKQPVVVYQWDVDAPAEVLEGLRRRAARVGYLGAADTPVAVTVHEELPATLPGPAFAPDDEGTLLIGVPRPGTVDLLDAHYDRWVAEGPNVQRSQSVGLRRLARYRDPSQPEAQDIPQQEIVWLRFERPVSGRRVTPLITTLKAAVLDRYQRTVGEPPPVLHGHHPPDAPIEHAMFVALPDVGFEHSTGRIHGAAIVLPPGTDPAVVDGCRTAVAGLTELIGPGLRVQVRPWAGEERPLAAHPRRWADPKRRSRRFATAFPALHERRTKVLTLSEIARWCEHANLPAPVAARSGRGPFVRGGVDLAPSEVNRPGKDRLPYSHLELELAEPVAGIVAVGAGRYRGLGLCVPLPEESS